MKSACRILAVWLLGILTGCSSSQPTNADTDYKTAVRAWHQQRIERLKQPDNWLSLAGLFWLDEGYSSFGTHNANDFTTSAAGPDTIGVFYRHSDSVWFTPQPGIMLSTD